MRDVDAELGQVRRRNAGSVARGRSGALDFALGKQGLEDRSRSQSRRCPEHRSGAQTFARSDGCR